jgi:hypothetical protein
MPTLTAHLNPEGLPVNEKHQGGHYYSSLSLCQKLQLLQPGKARNPRNKGAGKIEQEQTEATGKEATRLLFEAGPLLCWLSPVKISQAFGISGYLVSVYSAYSAVSLSVRNPSGQRELDAAQPEFYVVRRLWWS